MTTRGSRPASEDLLRFLEVEFGVRCHPHTKLFSDLGLSGEDIDTFLERLAGELNLSDQVMRGLEVRLHSRLPGEVDPWRALQCRLFGRDVTVAELAEAAGHSQSHAD
jgi:hypothetical protein